MDGKKWSIPTEYKGIMMRSRLETKWAEFFDENGIKWLYEPEGFQKDGVRYLPDFALPDLKIIFEVKGVMDNYDQKKKKIMLDICKECGWNYYIGFSDIPLAKQFEISGNKIQENTVDVLKAWGIKRKDKINEHTPYNELAILYIHSPEIRGKIVEIIQNYRGIFDKKQLDFFNSVEGISGIIPERVLDKYFKTEELLYFERIAKHYENNSEHDSDGILKDITRALEKKKLRNEMDKTDKKILEAVTEKEKLDFIKERLDLSKKMRKLMEEE